MIEISIPIIIFCALLAAALTVISFNYVRGSKTWRPGTNVSVYLLLWIFCPLAILYGLYLGLKKITLDTLADIRQEVRHSFEGSDPKTYEKTIDELIKLNIGSALLSEDEKIRNRAAYLEGKEM